MQRLLIPVCVLLEAMLLASACSRPQPSPYLAPSCPIAGGVRGYPVTVASSAPADTALLGSVARAMAESWSMQIAGAAEKSPVPPVVQMMDAKLLERRAFPRHGWRPSGSDTARLVLTYRAGLPAPEITLAHPGTPTSFEASVKRAALTAVARARETPGARYTLPLAVEVPNADTVALEVAFGQEPDSLSAVARFSVHERDILPMVTNRSPTYPPGALRAGLEGAVRVAFVVLPDSTIDPASIRVVRSSGPEFADAVVRALPSYRYVPAEIDCQLIPAVGLQPFAFGIGTSALVGR
jgi:TonB family protein